MSDLFLFSLCRFDRGDDINMISTEGASTAGTSSSDRVVQNILKQDLHKMTKMLNIVV